MDLRQVEVEGLDGSQDQGGFGVGGMPGQALQGAAEEVIVELRGADLVEAGQAGLLGPGTEAVQGLGAEQAVGDEDLGEGAQGDVAFPGDQAVDGVGEVEFVEVGLDHGQGADDLSLQGQRCGHGLAS